MVVVINLIKSKHYNLLIGWGGALFLESSKKQYLKIEN